MKLGKLLTLTALATGVTLGAFVDSATARGSGGRASGSKSNELVVEYEFDLFQLDTNLQPITLDNGTFKGVVENFKGVIFDRDENFLFPDVDQEVVFITDRFSDNFEVKSDLEFVLKEGEEPKIDQPNPLTLDLTPRFVSVREKGVNESIKLLDGEDAISTFYNGDSSTPPGTEIPLETSDDRIDYTLTGEGLISLGITELTLSIRGDFLDPDIFEEDRIARSLLDTPSERNQAVTSIDYILNNGILGLVNDIRVSGLSDAEPRRIITSETLGAMSSYESKSVPESSNNLGLLVLGGLGTSLLLKRTREQA